RETFKVRFKEERSKAAPWIITLSRIRALSNSLTSQVKINYTYPELIILRHRLCGLSELRPCVEDEGVRTGVLGEEK
ncbi:MAG: hypothetical protein DRH11_14760, partial [Deltaproteobacteria bacterium]